MKNFFSDVVGKVFGKGKEAERDCCSKKTVESCCAPKATADACCSTEAVAEKCCDSSEACCSPNDKK